jgi:hypothetical protein
MSVFLRLFLQLKYTFNYIITPNQTNKQNTIRRNSYKSKKQSNRAVALL